MYRRGEPQRLAMLGGQPVRQRPWPKWPIASASTERNLLDVLYSNRWTISGRYVGSTPYERRFAEAFAGFHDVQHCVPTANGSSAITIALEALNVGYGDEVLVPGLTWVACASAVAAIGAVPIPVDLDPETLCMSPDAARAAISDHTAAILLVHSYCTVADIDSFVAISNETGISIVEDSSQAHGAIWKGRRVGTFGRVGVFSFQQTKVLTAGEGGAAITEDPDLYSRMQQLRADGRQYVDGTPDIGDMELQEVGDVQGHNYCMSEFQAAVLLDRIDHLDEENERREDNANYLRSLLSHQAGFTPLKISKGVDRLTYYQFCLRLDRDLVADCNIDVIATALSKELGLEVDPIYSPLNANVLYNPLRSLRTPMSGSRGTSFDPARHDLPVAEKARSECLTFPHHALLGGHDDMDDFTEALAKIHRNAGALARAFS